MSESLPKCKHCWVLHEPEDCPVNPQQSELAAPAGSEDHPGISTCCTCGYSWRTGTDGSHSCPEWLLKRIAKLEKEWKLEHNITRLLVVGGFVSQEKVDEARRLLE